MRRILTVLAVALLVAAMMVAAAMPAFAYHFDDHVLVTGERGNKGKCAGFGYDENPGRYQNNGPPNGTGVGDDRNEACEKKGVCIGTGNN